MKNFYTIIGATSDEYGCTPIADNKVFTNLKDAKKELSEWYQSDKASYEEMGEIYFEKTPTKYTISNADKSYECVSRSIIKLEMKCGFK